MKFKLLREGVERDYLHGYCDEWVVLNFEPNDKIVALTQFYSEWEPDWEDGDIDEHLVHCCLVRGGNYIDASGTYGNIYDLMDNFDESPDECYSYVFNSVTEFKTWLRDALSFPITESVQYSSVDSLGNVLTPEQTRYFARSKVRDSSGRLAAVHHGTYNTFDSFAYGDIGFHFGTEKSANERRDFVTHSWDNHSHDDWKVGKYYLNITNPFRCDFDYESYDGIQIAVVWLFGTSYDGIIEFINDGKLGETYVPKEFSDASSMETIKDVVRRFAPTVSEWSNLPRDAEPNVIMRNLFKSKGYDGIEYVNAFEGAGDVSYIAFDPEQIKSVANKTPTNRKSIHEGVSSETIPTIDEVETLFSQLGFDKGGAINHSAFIFPDGKIFYNNTHEDFYIELCDRSMIKDYYEDFIVTKFNCIRCCDIDDYEHYIEIPQSITPRQLRTLSDWLDHSEETYEYKIIQLCSRNNGFEEKVYDLSKLRKDGEDTAKYILDRVKRCASSGVLYEKIEHMTVEEDSFDYDNLFVVDDVRELKNFMDRADWEEFRVVDSSRYDGHYYIGESRNYIHSQILKLAVDGGWFPNHNRMSINMQFRDTDFVVIYKGQDLDGNLLGDDGYCYGYVFDDYTILARDSIHNTDLIKKFGKLVKVNEVDYTWFDEDSWYEGEDNDEDDVNENLTESLQRLSSNAFITDSPYQIRDLLMNKPCLYRILYDSNIDMYIIGDGNEYIHWDLIRLARKYGYYAEMESFIDELGDLSNYVEFGEGGQFLDDEEIEAYLIYMVFSPDDEEFILGEDGYQFKYPLSFGVMFTRDSYLEDCDLYNVVKSYSVITEGRKDYSHLYPSVDEVQSYIDNNYSTDTLPPTGATYLMPNGLFIDISASGMSVHQEFDEKIYNDLVEEGDYVGEFGYTDLFLPRLGFIRCNDGSTWGNLLIHLPSQKPTREQYEALERWLDASLSMDMYNYIIIATDKATKRYDTGDYMTDELIVLIKRYYSSGRLYEGDEAEDKDSPTEDKQEPSKEEVAQEIKDNIKVSLTENS